jgi:RimJ/RimL family protein N-acetyltransferase
VCDSRARYVSPVTGYDISPLFRLRLRTPRLELRLPREDELAELAHVARRGVHPPTEMPFLVPWTDNLGSPSFIEDFIGFHLEVRSKWQADDWGLELGVWADGLPAGIQGIQAKHFDRDRTTSSGSWLAMAYHRKGYGTEMRAAILELAFAGLGATSAVSGAVEGNIASARVSEKLGYVDAGDTTSLSRGEPVREQRFLLTRERWQKVERPPVEIVGLEPCLPLFGLSLS